MSGGGGTNTVQRSDPWKGVQPELMSLYAGANKDVNTPRQFYPHTTVAPWSGTTLDANSRLFQRASNGNPLLDQAQGEAGRTLQGDYLSNPASANLLDMGSRDFVARDPNMDSLRSAAEGYFLNSNPHLDSMFNRAAGQVGRQFSKNVMPGVASMFAGAGRFGSNQMADGMGQAQEQYGRTLDDLATGIYGQNYANERQLMQQAAEQLGQFGMQGAGLNLGALGEFGGQFGRERGLMMGTSSMAPGLADADYSDIGRLEALGQKQEAEHQGRINDDMQRWNFGQNEYFNRLAQYNQLLQGTAGLGGTTQTSQTGGGNPAMGAMGGAMMGGTLASMAGGAGAGAAAGAAGGAATGASLGLPGMILGALAGGLMSR
jgi:hypothetical protein